MLGSQTRPRAGFAFYGIGERRCVAADLLPPLQFALDVGPLENPPRHLAAHILVEVHLPDSVDRAPESRIGNCAMFVVRPIGRRRRGIAQLPVAVRHREPLVEVHRHYARNKTRADRAASLAGIGFEALHGEV